MRENSNEKKKKSIDLMNMNLIPLKPNDYEIVLNRKRLN